LLRIGDLHVEYRTLEGVVHAVNGINLVVKPGKALGLVGETGAGKTTTALAIMGLVPKPPGVVRARELSLEDKDLLSLSDNEMQRIRGNQISMIFQNPMASLNPVHTAGQQIAEVLRLHQKMGKHEARRYAAEMLRKVGLVETCLDDYPHELSGGMKQRVMIAMALACRPKLLIADEPTTALDVTIQAQVMEMMKGLKDEYAGSLILITHDLGLVAEICDDVVLMYSGRLVERGSLQQVFGRPSHPYTQGLFGSIPVLDRHVDRLQPIKGLSPDPKDLPQGCAFHPRCPMVKDVCRSVLPEMVNLEEGHGVACWLFASQGRETSD